MTEEVFAAIHRYISAIHPGNRPERIKITLADGSKIDLRFPAMFEPIVPTKSELPIKYGPDFMSVFANGEEYTFTSKQAEVVRVLIEAYENGTPNVGQAALLEAAESPQGELKDVFRNQEAWGTLIIPGKRKGTFRLNI